ncbi:hypothetical protein LXL04_018342 [Taraxacum kok-saghyz]
MKGRRLSIADSEREKEKRSVLEDRRFLEQDEECPAMERKSDDRPRQTRSHNPIAVPHIHNESVTHPIHLRRLLRFAVCDSPLANAADSSPSIAVLIVPKNRETDWNFCTESGQMQLLFRLRVSHLILIAEINSPIVGEFLVEDVELVGFSDRNKQLRRRSRFKRMPGVIQSQALFVPIIGDDEATTQTDLESLRNIESAKFESDTRVLVHQILNRHALCFGIGGGVLLNFLNTQMKFEVTGVEIDPMVIMLQHFILVRLKNGFCATPQEFVKKHIFEGLRSLLDEQGGLIINVVPLNKVFYETLVKELKEVFHKVYQIDIENEDNFVVMAIVSPPSFENFEYLFLNKLKSLIPGTYRNSMKYKFGTVEIFFQCILGSNNDINVLNQSSLFNDVLQGYAPECIFTVNDTTYTKGYYLADGIYPEWATMVKSFPHPTDPKRIKFKEMQEAAIKEVERAFGVLQSRWAIVRGPTRSWQIKNIKDIMYTCIILHNMIVEDEGNDISNWLDDVDPPIHVHRGPAQEIERNSELRDSAVHHALRHDLMEHIWERFWVMAAKASKQTSRRRFTET